MSPDTSLIQAVSCVISSPIPFASILDDTTASTRHSASGLGEAITQETHCRSDRVLPLHLSGGHSCGCAPGRPDV